METLNATDLALWEASNRGDREVGVIELLDDVGRVIKSTNFSYETSVGSIVERQVHVPIKARLLEMLNEIDVGFGGKVIRFTHVHPRLITSTGRLIFGPIWMFSPGDIKFSYAIKFLLELKGLDDFSVDSHLIYQLPFTARPSKRIFAIASQQTWKNKDYSLGRAADRAAKSLVNRRN